MPRTATVGTSVSRGTGANVVFESLKTAVICHQGVVGRTSGAATVGRVPVASKPPSPEGGRASPGRVRLRLAHASAAATLARVQALLTPDLVVVRAAVERAGRLLLVRRAPWDSLPGAWEL